MILITLGTQDKSFVRLLEAIQKQIDNKIIVDEVVVQAGYTKFESKDMKILDLVPMDEFERLMKDCDLLITHGGVGSILTGLKNHKKVIAAARLEKYEEHTNDHQIQIIDRFYKLGYILKLEDFDKLDDVLKESEDFKIKEYTENNDKICELISNFIKENVSN